MGDTSGRLEGGRMEKPGNLHIVLSKVRLNMSPITDTSCSSCCFYPCELSFSHEGLALFPSSARWPWVLGSSNSVSLRGLLLDSYYCLFLGYLIVLYLNS